eukprot:scaffold46940_cov63-Phaeocystis_antarctica.AAC.2
MQYGSRQCSSGGGARSSTEPILRRLHASNNSSKKADIVGNSGDVRSFHPVSEACALQGVQRGYCRCNSVFNVACECRHHVVKLPVPTHHPLPVDGSISRPCSLPPLACRNHIVTTVQPHPPH